MVKMSIALTLSFFVASPLVFAQSTSPTHLRCALPTIPDQHFKITDHGAVADNATDNTKAIQDTIDAADNAGGGIVEVPRR